jgi:hypothetical protein
VTDLRMDPKEMVFYVKFRLECGATAELFQRQPGIEFELIVTPKPGTTVADFATVKEDRLHLSMHEGSAIGLFQILGMVIAPRLKKRKFLGLF